MQQQSDKSIRILDKAVPLRGASHADVVDYWVEIPMRYAECFARLRDGRVVRLADRRQFLGWSGYGRKPSLLLCHGNRQIVLQSGPASNAVFVGRDGSQVMAKRWRTTMLRYPQQEEASAARSTTAIDPQTELTGQFGPAAMH